MDIPSTSIHHLVPRSRLPNDMIQCLNPINTAKKLNFVHRAWHQIFSNLTPFEAIVFYITTIAPSDFIYAEISVFWEGVISDNFLLGETTPRIEKNVSSKNNFLKIGHIFDYKKPPIEVPKIIVREWSPSNFFYFMKIVDCRGNKFSYFSPELKLSTNQV